MFKLNSFVRQWQPLQQLGFYNMSHVIGKPVYAICEQQRRRSSPISTFVVRCLDSIISLVSISEISSL